MTQTSATLEQLVDQFSKLPGIGRKTAFRLAYHVLKAPPEAARELARAIMEVKEKIRTCSECYNISDDDPCPICADDERNHKLICVVEEPHDVVAFQRAGGYDGVFHVLGGVFAPLDGVGPEDLKIAELVARAKKGADEIILATNPTPEGETTALYIAKLLKPLGVTVTRIARGLPMGGDVEYADQHTLAKALEGRTEF
jgi:recombination protein RecR